MAYDSIEKLEDTHVAIRSRQIQQQVPDLTQHVEWKHAQHCQVSAERGVCNYNISQARQTSKQLEDARGTVEIVPRLQDVVKGLKCKRDRVDIKPIVHCGRAPQQIPEI
ncbi:hypothetical protein H257_05607 [Aphanomyces astaci]|uniref:Tektin n=1 Tax=Aphanomyces astaci TaxID=112090 RepID=W4GQY4_APHAT|nr:hypothetical protein H257_05607 [Aphanomyces astaci]ETV82097.1 hypothetical protein H257_05607 [Aphanomyces astaci]|eukprot:XP_009828834.1 hypothetical protein H257_05607 [Aphanomyces astaci]